MSNWIHGIFILMIFASILTGVYSLVRFIQETVKVRKKRKNTAKKPPNFYLLVSITNFLMAIFLYITFGDTFKNINFSQAKFTLESVLSGASLFVIGMVPLIIIRNRCKDADENEKKHEDEKKGRDE